MIVGKIYFLLVRIKIRHMELAIIKREIAGTGKRNHDYRKEAFYSIRWTLRVPAIDICLGGGLLCFFSKKTLHNVNPLFSKKTLHNANPPFLLEKLNLVPNCENLVLNF